MPGEARMTNAMTVDVEDYFQVSAFDRVVNRDAWPGMESRVVANTERLLDLFDEFDVRGTFFVLGWVAERHPSLVRMIVARGHELASHGYGHRLVTRRRRTSSARTCAGPAAARGHRGWCAAIERRASRSPRDHRRSTCSSRSTTADASVFQSGTIATAFQTRRLAHDRPAGEPRLRSADRPFASAAPTSQSRADTSASSVCMDAFGISRVNRVERQPMSSTCTVEIDPDQPRLPAGVLSRFQHYRNLHHTENRLRRLTTSSSRRWHQSFGCAA
jgi:hypothetical protein